MNLILLFTRKSEELASESPQLLRLIRSGKPSQVKVKEPKLLTRSMEGCRSGKPAVPVVVSEIRRYVDHRQGRQLWDGIKG